MQEVELNSLPEGVQLCLHCGLCCTGYFHEKAMICNDTDLLLAQQMGATVITDDDSMQWFALPCPKFEGKCSVYPERPSVCEAHKCDLLMSVNVKEVTLEKGKSVVDEMKFLCKSLDNALLSLTSPVTTKHMETCYKPLLTPEMSEVRKKNPSIFLKYAAFLVLLKKHFYKN